MAFGGLSNPRFCVLLSPALTQVETPVVQGELVGLGNISFGADIELPVRAKDSGSCC